MSQNTKRVVIKIGTSILTQSEHRSHSEKAGKAPLVSLVTDICFARSKGAEVLLVTSGSIGAGMKKLGWARRPHDIRMKQAVAAIGQVTLMQTYERLFQRHKTQVAQLLLTRTDFEDRTRYLNARTTLLTLLRLGIVPIINENDTVATEEIQFGDNDKLSALIAAKIDADLLMLLTDVDGLYRSGSAEIIPLITKITPEIERHAERKSKSGLGTGGMASKIEAAKIATASGVTTVVASGLTPCVIRDILEGKGIGTRFIAKGSLSAREKWILFSARPLGDLWIDSGAIHAIKTLRKSLLPAGILEVRGRFQKGEIVRIMGEDGREFARGIASYSSEEIQKIKGRRSNEIKKILKDVKVSSEIIHRDSLVLLPYD